METKANIFYGELYPDNKGRHETTIFLI